MAIPTPPQDNSGGFIIIKNSGGPTPHRMRFHVAAFNLDPTGTYQSVPAGLETSVQQTAANVMLIIKDYFKTDHTLSLDQVFQMQSGVPVEVFNVTPPSAVTCTNVGTTQLNELYLCWNFRSALGGRARFFMFSSTASGYQVPATVNAGNTGDNDRLVSYFSGGSPTGPTNKTQVVAHDGSALLSPARIVYGFNKKLRRRAGDA